MVQEKPPEVKTRHGHIDLAIDEREIYLCGFDGFNDALAIANFILKKFGVFLRDPNVLKLCTSFWIDRKSGELDPEYSICIYFAPLRERGFRSFLHEFGKSRFANLPVSIMTEEEKRFLRALVRRPCYGNFNGSPTCYKCPIRDDCVKKRQKRS